MNLLNYLRLHSTKILWSYIICIAILVTIPVQRQGVIINNYHVVHIRLDHLLHGLLMMLWFFLIIRLHGMKVLPAILLGILLALSAGGVQYFLTYRAFNVNDMISNSIGELVGMGVLIFTIGDDARLTTHGSFLLIRTHDTRPTTQGRRCLAVLRSCRFPF